LVEAGKLSIVKMVARSRAHSPFGVCGSDPSESMFSSVVAVFTGILAWRTVSWWRKRGCRTVTGLQGMATLPKGTLTPLAGRTAHSSRTEEHLVGRQCLMESWSQYPGLLSRQRSP
jgi:hypothetical protein